MISTGQSGDEVAGVCMASMAFALLGGGIGALTGLASNEVNRNSLIGGAVGYVVGIIILTTFVIVRNDEGSCLNGCSLFRRSSSNNQAPERNEDDELLSTLEV